MKVGRAWKIVRTVVFLYLQIQAFSPTKHPTMKRTLLLFCLCSFCFIRLDGQSFQPINALHPAKDYPGEMVRAADGSSSLALIRTILNDFELEKKHLVAILINGKYEARIHGDGTFEQEKTAERLEQKIVLGAVERIEARYDLNYNDPWSNTPYKGTINILMPALENPNMDPNAPPEPDPEPWENPMTKRLLAAQEPDVKVRHIEANSAPRAGFFVGSQLQSRSIFVGAPVEIPLTQRFSLYGSVMWNWKSRDLSETDSTGFTQTTSTVEQAMEICLMGKLHLNNTYPRYHAMAGPYWERDRQKVDYFGLPVNSEYGKVHNAVGMNVGVGVLFYNGLDVNLGWSVVFTPQNKLLPFQDLRGFSISVGWMFGRP